MLQTAILIQEAVLVGKVFFCVPLFGASFSQTPALCPARPFGMEVEVSAPFFFLPVIVQNGLTIS